MAMEPCDDMGTYYEDLGARYAERMRKSIELTPQDEDKIIELLRESGITATAKTWFPEES